MLSKNYYCFLNLLFFCSSCSFKKIKNKNVFLIILVFCFLFCRTKNSLKKIVNKTSHEGVSSLDSLSGKALLWDVVGSWNWNLGEHNFRTISGRVHGTLRHTIPSYPITPPPLYNRRKTVRTAAKVHCMRLLITLF